LKVIPANKLQDYFLCKHLFAIFPYGFPDLSAKSSCTDTTEICASYFYKN